MGGAGVAACTVWYIATCTGYAYCRGLGCIRPRASGRVRSTSSLKLSRRVPLSAGGGGGGGSGAVVPARPAPRLARRLRSFFLRLSHGCRLTCHGAARHQGVLDARIGVRASWGRARAPGATKGGTASGRLDLANMFDWVTLAHLITRQTAPFECSAGSVPSRSSRTLRVRRRAVLAGGGLGRPGFCITGPAAGCCHQDGSLPE